MYIDVQVWDSWDGISKKSHNVCTFWKQPAWEGWNSNKLHDDYEMTSSVNMASTIRAVKNWKTYVARKCSLNKFYARFLNYGRNTMHSKNLQMDMYECDFQVHWWCKRFSDSNLRTFQCPCAVQRCLWVMEIPLSSSPVRTGLSESYIIRKTWQTLQKDKYAN